MKKKLLGFFLIFVLVLLVAGWTNMPGNTHFSGIVNLVEWRINNTEVTATATELNLMDGVTATTTELNLIDGVLASTAELNSAANSDYLVWTPSGTPVGTENDGTVLSGTGGAENVLMFYPGVQMEMHMIGTQDLVTPVIHADGLEISLDDANNDGVEYGFGITDSNPFACQSGTDACTFAVKIDSTDVSGSDFLAVGWRGDEAYQAAFDNYNDLVALNCESGDIYTEHIDDNGATNSTDTNENWADGETHTLEVRVSAAGTATYYIDGTAVSGHSHSVDTESTDILVPFIYFLNDTDVNEAVYLIQVNATVTQG